jgi:DNA-binding CsgD family transcriptional regulator
VHKSAPVLTPRELEVLAFSAKGKTSAAVGGLLGITKRTVDEHRQRFIRKLGASNITHAVALALASGIIGLP